MAAGIKKTFYKVKDGFIYNMFYKDGEPVQLKPGQEKYLILSGALSETPPATAK